MSVFCPDITGTEFLSSGRLKGIPPEIAAAGLPLDRLQSAAHAADLLLAGLEHGRFLISAVPGTHEKLAAMAEADLAPGSECRAGGMAPVVQFGRVTFPAERLDEALGAFAKFAGESGSHHGCLTYVPAIDAADRNTIRIFEVWSDQAAVDAHAAAPSTNDFPWAVVRPWRPRVCRRTRYLTCSRTTLIAPTIVRFGP